VAAVMSAASPVSRPGTVDQKGGLESGVIGIPELAEDGGS
jgi:hypothetical protein